MLKFFSDIQGTLPNKSHVHHPHILWHVWVSISVLPVGLVGPLQKLRRIFIWLLLKDLYSIQAFLLGYPLLKPF